MGYSELEDELVAAEIVGRFSALVHSVMIILIQVVVAITSIIASIVAIFFVETRQNCQAGE